MARQIAGPYPLGIVQGVGVSIRRRIHAGQEQACPWSSGTAAGGGRLRGSSSRWLGRRRSGAVELRTGKLAPPNGYRSLMKPGRRQVRAR